MSIRNQRRKIIVDPTFQWNFVLKFCLVVILSSVLLGWLVYVFSTGSTTVAIENTKVVVKPTADFIVPVLIFTVILVAWGTAVVILFMALFMSHRIAGPLLRLSRELEYLQQGNLTRDIFVRSTDQMQALAHRLNQMNKIYREKHVGMQDTFQRLTRYLEDRNYDISKKDRDALVEMLKQLRVDLTYFKV